LAVLICNDKSLLLWGSTFFPKHCPKYKKLRWWYRCKIVTIRQAALMSFKYYFNYSESKPTITIFSGRSLTVNLSQWQQYLVIRSKLDPIESIFSDRNAPLNRENDSRSMNHGVLPCISISSTSPCWHTAMKVNTFERACFVLYFTRKWKRYLGLLRIWMLFYERQYWTSCCIHLNLYLTQIQWIGRCL
jgi:hypothetical protein